MNARSPHFLISLNSDPGPVPSQLPSPYFSFINLRAKAFPFSLILGRLPRAQLGTSLAASAELRLGLVTLYSPPDPDPLPPVDEPPVAPFAFFAREIPSETFLTPRPATPAPSATPPAAASTPSPVGDVMMPPVPLPPAIAPPRATWPSPMTIRPAALQCSNLAEPWPLNGMPSPSNAPAEKPRMASLMGSKMSKMPARTPDNAEPSAVGGSLGDVSDAGACCGGAGDGSGDGGAGDAGASGFSGLGKGGFAFACVLGSENLSPGITRPSCKCGGSGLRSGTAIALVPPGSWSRIGFPRTYAYRFVPSTIP